MCGCSVNLAVPQGGSKPPCNCKLHLKNDVESVLMFVLDNNESAVREALAGAGIDVSGLSKKELATYLEISYAQGYNIAPYVNVPYRNDADNHTGGIATEMYGTDGASRMKFNLGEIIGIVLGGLGAYFGTGIFLNGGQNNTPPPPPPSSPSVPIWAWVVGGFALILLIVVLIKR